MTKTIAALKFAETFMAGFEDDPNQHGVADNLVTIRAMIAGLENRQASASSDRLAFTYYEVRPCIEFKGNGDAGHTKSFRSKAEYEAALDAVDKSGKPYQTFWTLYGMVSVAGWSDARVIGDFTNEGAAFEVMNAILAVPAAAMHRIRDGKWSPCAGAPGSFISASERAACDIEDMILQSSNDERI